MIWTSALLAACVDARCLAPSTLRISPARCWLCATRYHVLVAVGSFPSSLVACRRSSAPVPNHSVRGTHTPRLLCSPDFSPDSTRRRDPSEGSFGSEAKLWSGIGLWHGFLFEFLSFLLLFFFSFGEGSSTYPVTSISWRRHTTSTHHTE